MKNKNSGSLLYVLRFSLEKGKSFARKLNRMFGFAETGKYDKKDQATWAENI